MSFISSSMSLISPQLHSIAHWSGLTEVHIAEHRRKLLRKSFWCFIFRVWINFRFISFHDENGWKKAQRPLEQARQITSSLYVNSKLRSLQCCWLCLEINAVCLCVDWSSKTPFSSHGMYFVLKPSGFTLIFALFVLLCFSAVFMLCFFHFVSFSQLAFASFLMIAINRIARRLQISRALRSFLGFFGCIHSLLYEHLLF